MPERQADAASGKHPFDKKKQRICHRANKKRLNPPKRRKNKQNQRDKSEMNFLLNVKGNVSPDSI